MQVEEVGFYHLTRARLEDALPPLLEKVLERGLRAVVVVRDTDRLQDLDTHLWTYRPDSFLAHGTGGSGFAERQPVLLTTTVENPNGADLLVLTDDLVPPADAAFRRIVDLFDGTDASALAAARERWRLWRDRRVPALVYWQQRPEGGWTKAREEHPAEG